MLLAALIATVSCAKDREAESIAAQEQIIDTYWATVDSTLYEKTVADDVYRIVTVKGDEAQKVAAGDSIFFYYKGAILSRSGLETANIFSTNIAAVAEELGLTSAEGLEIHKSVAGVGSFISGLEKGLLRMYKGETALIMFTSKHGYGGKAMSIIPKFSPIIFEIQLVDVKKQ